MCLEFYLNFEASYEELNRSNIDLFDGRRSRGPFLCLSVCLSVKPAVSGMCGADGQQTNKFCTKFNSVRLQFLFNSKYLHHQSTANF